MGKSCSAVSEFWIPYLPKYSDEILSKTLRDMIRVRWIIPTSFLHSKHNTYELCDSKGIAQSAEIQAAEVPTHRNSNSALGRFQISEKKI